MQFHSIICDIVFEILKIGKDSHIVWQLQRAMLLLKMQLKRIRCDNVFSEKVQHKHSKLHFFYILFSSESTLWQCLFVVFTFWRRVASGTEVSAKLSCMFHMIWRSTTTPNNNNFVKNDIPLPSLTSHPPDVTPALSCSRLSSVLWLLMEELRPNFRRN